MTSNVNSATAGGLSLVSNTYHTFGNNGTTSFHGSTNSGGNTSLNAVTTDGGTFISATQLKLDLPLGQRPSSGRRRLHDSRARALHADLSGHRGGPAGCPWREASETRRIIRIILDEFAGAR